MEQHGEGAGTEKLSQGTIGARRLLQVVSLIGFLVAIVPLSTDSVSVFGIGFSIGGEALKGMLAVVLAYLMVAFAVRVLTDLAAAGPSRLEVRLWEKINAQTDDIGKRTEERLANLLLSGPGEKFHSGSFASLLNDAVPKTSEYRTAMINNTISDIRQWKSRKSWANDSKGAASEATFAHEFEPVLDELLSSHEASCKRRCLLNAPLWVWHRALIAVRSTFLDALAPLLIALLVIALLCGWMDGAWFVESLGAVAS